MILITGTGRCGTGFIANLLTSTGVGCSHEGVFCLHGWEYALAKIKKRRTYPGDTPRAESSWLAAPHLNKPELYSMLVVHLVRKPEDVVMSLMRMGFFEPHLYVPYSSYAIKFSPQIEYEPNALEMSARMYIEYNLMVERRADIFHRIEDDPAKLLDKLGINYAGRELFSDTKFNHRDEFEHKTKFEDLTEKTRDMLQRMGEKYGY